MDSQRVSTTLNPIAIYLEKETSLPSSAQKEILKTLTGQLDSLDIQISPRFDRLRGVHTDLSGKSSSYAIHNDDLGLLKESITVAAALYAALQNPVAIIGGLVFLLYTYRKKRVKLTARQAVVLQSLKKAGEPGWSAHDLSLYLPLRLAISDDEIEAILAELSNIRQEDGTLTSLTSCQSGYWRAVDV